MDAPNHVAYKLRNFSATQSCTVQTHGATAIRRTVNYMVVWTYRLTGGNIKLVYAAGYGNGLGGNNTFKNSINLSDADTGDERENC